MILVTFVVNGVISDMFILLFTRNTYRLNAKINQSLNKYILNHMIFINTGIHVINEWNKIIMA